MGSNRFKVEALDMAKRLVNMLVLYLVIYPLAIILILIGNATHQNWHDPSTMALWYKILSAVVGIGWGLTIMYCDKYKKLRVWK